MAKFIRFAEQVAYWGIVGIPFSIAIAPAFTSALVGITMVFFLAKWVAGGVRNYKGSAIDLAFLALLGISLVSIVNAVSLEASIKGILKYCQYAMIFIILIAEVKDKLHIKRMVLSMALGGVLASVDAGWQIAFGKDFIRGNLPIINIGLMRASAAFPNANGLGVYLAPLAPFVIGLALYNLKGKAKVATLIAGLLIVVGIVMTWSRPAALGCFLALLIIGIVRRDKVLLSILVALLAISPIIAPRSIKQWAKDVNYNPIVFMCNPDRMSMYRNTMNMISHHPIIGVGLSNFSRSYHKYKLYEPENAITGDSVYAHNNFLHTAGEVGLLGLAALLWLIFALFKKNISIYRKLKDPQLAVLSLCLIAALAAYLINGLTETNLYYGRLVPLFWYLVGFSLALEKFVPLTKTL